MTDTHYFEKCEQVRLLIDRVERLGKSFTEPVVFQNPEDRNRYNSDRCGVNHPMEFSKAVDELRGLLSSLLMG